MSAPPSSPALKRARQVSHVLDQRYVDPVLGLLAPGVGDVLSSSLGLYLVYIAWKEGRSKILLARMLINLGVDAALGVIPIAGDAFDFFFKANRRNLALLERSSRETRKERIRDSLFVGAAALFFLGALAVPVLALVALLSWAF